MKTKKLFLLLASILLLVMMTVTASAAVEYTVVKPTGHTASGTKYPTVYLMPQDGYKANAQDMALAKLLANEGLNTVVIVPEFTADDVLHQAMAELVAEVDADASLHTIANSKQRALVGIGTGGYLSYVLGMTDANGNLLSEPDLFAAVASIRGNFADASNPWLTKYGSVYSKLSDAKSVVGKFYTYMDAPVDDAWTNQAGSTNDLGYLFIGFGTSADCHEYTARLGAYNDAFMQESAKRIADRLSRWMVGSTFYTQMKSVIVTAADDYADVPYSVMGLPSTYYGSNFGGAIEYFAPNYGSIPMKITLSAYDTQTGEKLASSASVDGYAAFFSGAKGTIRMKNVTGGKTVALKMHAEALGYTFEIATGNMVFRKEPVVNGDHQEFDLIGDWKFKYTGKDTVKVSELLSSKEYESWATVTPTLGWWASGFGGLSSGYETGNSYYVREFVLPEGFDAQELVLSVGYVDDCCEVFINGKRVGATGINANGEVIDPTASTWDKYSSFSVDPSILKHNGETNTIVVRDVNNSGGGGWYAGPISLYSKTAFEAESGGSAAEFTDTFYEETYHSDVIGQDMEYLIYLPKDYDKTDRYYPTLYLLHQFTSTHLSYMNEGIKGLMDEAIEKGLLDQMIVVIPNSDGNSWWKGKWESMVMEDLIPHIDKNYRTIDDARYRFTAGCSMGGQGAYSVALTNPDFFSGVAGFYGAYDFGDYMGEISPITIAKKETAEYMKNFAMGFICGNQDDWRFGRGHIRLNQQLEKMGVDHYFFIENGAHNQDFYVPYFKDTVSYVWNNMYDEQVEDANKPNLRAMAYAALEATDAGVIPVFAVTDAIAEYYNLIPESNLGYTGNPTPELSIPLRITVTQDGRKYQAIIRDHQIEQGVNVNVLDALTAEDFALVAGGDAAFDPAKKFTYQIEACIFDEAWVKLDRIPADLLAGLELPNTGDDSSLMLYAALLAVCAAAIALLGRKKANA